MNIQQNGTRSRCKFIFNDKEKNNLKFTNTSDFFEEDYLVKIVRPSKKTRAQGEIFDKQDYITSFESTQVKNPGVKVLPFFQFPNGFVVDKRNLKVIREIQLDSTLPAIVFQEGNKKQAIEEFSKDLREFMLDERTDEKEIFLFMSPTSKKFLAKVNFALNLGITNFILRGEKYSDARLWVTTISKIHVMGGTVFCSIPKRYSPRSKISYMKPLVEYGADYVFHQAFSPPLTQTQAKNILYLGKGFKYFDELSQGNVLPFLREKFGDELSNLLSKNRGREYELSRIISIAATQKLFESVVIYEVLQTE